MTSTDEIDFWNRVAEYEQQYSQQDFHGASVAAALKLRRDADDMIADLADWAAYCGDTEDETEYIGWLQKAGHDVSNRIDLILGMASTEERAEEHLVFAYAILRELSADALSRRPPATPY